jgi:hypothetical protein
MGRQEVTQPVSFLDSHCWVPLTDLGKDGQKPKGTGCLKNQKCAFFHHVLWTNMYYDSSVWPLLGSFPVHNSYELLGNTLAELSNTISILVVIGVRETIVP